MNPASDKNGIHLQTRCSAAYPPPPPFPARFHFLSFPVLSFPFLLRFTRIIGRNFALLMRCPSLTLSNLFSLAMVLVTRTLIGHHQGDRTKPVDFVEHGRGRGGREEAENRTQRCAACVRRGFSHISVQRRSNWR